MKSVVIFTVSVIVAAWLLSVARAPAQPVPPPVDIPCPTEEPCKVLVLTQTEASVLTQDNGILATAAQARNLDLGQFVSYFRQKIALAPAGKMQPKPEAPPPPVAGTPPAGAAKLPEAPAKQPEAAKK